MSENQKRTPEQSVTSKFLMACGLTLAVSGPSYGAATIDPQTQPALTLAPYVARGDDLSLGETQAYRPWFENGAWQGDIIEYNIDTYGTRTTDVLVGDNPASSGTDNWSARARFDATENGDSDWWENREIYTADEDGAAVSFTWDKLSQTQRAALDPDTAADTAKVGAFDSPVLNYIRGDRSLERDKQYGIYRIRYNLLGAIINSRPVYAAYRSEADPYASERVYVGANDGMVHAFNAKTGDEVWAYVPSMLLHRLERHGMVPYNIQYMVDGQLRLSSVVTAVNDHVPTRKAILTSGLGAGERGLFALDVDSADTPVVLWEKSGSDSDVGYIHGRPNVAPIPVDGGRAAAVVTGNGYGSENGRAVLFKIGLDGTESKVVIDAGPGNGLSAPTLIDLNNDGIVDYAYAGDIKGNLWKIDLRTDAVTKLFAAGVNRPITVEPEIARLPAGGLMLYFGTGSLLSGQDASNVDSQAIFGIIDDGALVSANALLVQTLSEAEFGTKRLRIANGEEFDPATHSGWIVELPLASERLLGRPVLRGNRLQFVSTVTSGTFPEGWLIQLNYMTGGVSGVALFDIDEDGELTSDDSVTVGESSSYPVGRFLGVGNFSQPTLLRLGQGLDVSFVNGLLLPLPPLGNGIVFGGDIDVTTDSGTGPSVEPASPYPNPDGIVGTADGLGGNVDGHVHAYDKVHGVTYVDFFELEPRVGLARLDAALSTTDGDPIVTEPELNRVNEVEHALGTTVSGFDPKQKFIVAMTNADLSKGVELQIGCRTWNAYEYQTMLTKQLKDGVSPSALKDTAHGDQPLVFSLEDIRSEICGASGGSGTLRLTVADRVGKDGVLHATLPGCVNNTTQHDPKKPVADPHITPVQESAGKGYRWRNGALTAQLLKVNADGSAAFELQDVDSLPTYNKGDGGIFAAGFSVAKDKVVTALESTIASGLLYELTMFWHHGDMYDHQQEGQPPVCYGEPTYNANTSIDLRGINLGQYDKLLVAATREKIEGDYASALAGIAAALGSGDEEALRVALKSLGLLLQDAALARYHALRGYAPGVVPVQHLLDIDRQLGDGGGGIAVDQTPAEVDDVSQDDNPTRGPNFVPGRRTWIDLRPQ